jgi:pyrroline-5-carboxylate reductase
MLQDQIIAVLGAGNIGRALIGGLLRGGELAPEQIRATRRSPVAIDDLKTFFPGIHAGADNAEAVTGATIVILAVKPQAASGVLKSIRAHISRETLLISVLAGTTTESIRTALDQDLAIVRAMPNTPALVDEGATALAGGRYTMNEHLLMAQSIFDRVGIVEIVPEHLMDAVTGLSGSGPAYIYMVIEALTDGGVKMGIPRAQALRLAAKTVLGAARLTIETGQHPAILRDEVTTPGGTAIAAVAELEKHGLRTMLIDAVATATERARQLSQIED